MADLKCGGDFPETADIEASSDDYARRFAGTVGAWFLDVQERALFSLLVCQPGVAVLDVGGGHGQAAAPLCRRGYRVTVLGSDKSCRHRIASLVEAGTCDFRVGNVLALPFPDRSFPAVTCFRLLPHCARWPELVAELCRVSGGEVIVDYPTRRSLNLIGPSLFGAKKRIERNTRQWRMFADAEIVDEFRRHGFRLSATRRQFFLPMVLHRALGVRILSIVLEGACRAFGLQCLLGSPVMVRMVRE